MILMFKVLFFSFLTQMAYSNFGKYKHLELYL